MVPNHDGILKFRNKDTKKGDYPTLLPCRFLLEHLPLLLGFLLKNTLCSRSRCEQLVSAQGTELLKGPSTEGSDEKEGRQ